MKDSNGVDLPAETTVTVPAGTENRRRAMAPGWLMVAVGVGAAAVSMIGSGYVSLWTDEAATISAASRSMSDLFRMLGNIDVVHGAYYAFMHFWIAVFGSGPFSLRLPSALAVGAATVAVFRLGVHWRDMRTGLIAAVLFAVLPRVTYLGIEARPFAIATALAAWASYVVVAACVRPRAWNWVIYALLMALGIAFNIYVALLIPAHAIAVLRHKRARLPWLIAAAAAGLVGAPVVLEATRQTGQLGGGPLGWIEYLRGVVVNQWFLGETPTTTTGRSTTSLSWTDPASWWAPAAVALAACVATLCVFAVVRALRASTRDGREALWWLLPWIAVPTLVIGMYSIYANNVYNPRYLAIAAPAVALLAGFGVSYLRARWQVTVAVLLVVMCAAPVYLSQRQIYAKNGSDWVTVAQVVQERATAGEAVYFAPRYALTGGPIQQTTRGAAVAYPEPFRDLIDLTIETPPAQAANLTGFSRPLAESVDRLAGVDAVWMIERVDYNPDYAAADSATLAKAGFTQRDEVWAGPLSVVVRYSRG